MTETHYLADILVLLAAAIIAVPVFQRLAVVQYDEIAGTGVRGKRGVQLPGVVCQAPSTNP